MTQLDAIDSRQRELLKHWAAKYIWWKTPEDAMRRPERIIAQVMNIGDYDDVQEMAHALGDDILRHVILGAEAGMFDGRSWAYWHYRLGLAAPNRVPPLPKRRLT